MERARCLRAVSQIAPGRLRPLPLRHYGRCARSSLIKGFGVAQAAPNYREAQPEAEPGVKLGECRDGAPKGERARKRMSAVTRNVRGARRTGRGFGCAHPKRQCGG